MKKGEKRLFGIKNLLLAALAAGFFIFSALLYPQGVLRGGISFAPPPGPEWKGDPGGDSDTRTFSWETKRTLSNQGGDPDHVPYVSGRGVLFVYVDEMPPPPGQPSFDKPEAYVRARVAWFDLSDPEVKPATVGKYQGFVGKGRQAPRKDISEAEARYYESAANVVAYHIAFCALSPQGKPLRLDGWVELRWSGLLGPWDPAKGGYAFTDNSYGRKEAEALLEQERKVLEAVFDSLKAPVSPFRLEISAPNETTDPLQLTVRLVEVSPDGRSERPVRGAVLTLHVYDRQNNDRKLKEVFFANGKAVAVQEPLSKPPQVTTDDQGQVELLFLLDFGKIAANAWTVEGVVPPGDPRPLCLPIEVEYSPAGASGDQANASRRVCVGHVAVIRAMVFHEPKIMNAFRVPGDDSPDVLPVQRGRLEDYESGAGAQRVQIHPRGNASSARTAKSGECLRIADVIAVSTLKMTGYNLSAATRARDDEGGRIGVFLHFLDGVDGLIMLKEGTTARLEIQETPEKTGFDYPSTQVLKIISKEGAQVAISAFVPGVGPVFILDNAVELVGHLLDITPMIVRLNSQVMIDFEKDGGRIMSTREGSPILYTGKMGGSGVSVPAGMTATITPEGAVKVSETDSGAAVRADALIAELKSVSASGPAPPEVRTPSSRTEARKREKAEASEGTRVPPQQVEAEEKTPPALDELEAARIAKEAAFEKYTKLATEGGEGLNEALDEYKKAYARYKELQEKHGKK